MALPKRAAYLQPYYVYDPNVADELGGLLVKSDDKGKYVLAAPSQVQYWMDQGLLGEKPLGEISESSRKLLDQVTRGRSKDNDKRPRRVPKYSKAVQSGALGFAGTSAAGAIKRRKKAKGKNGNGPKKPAPGTASAAPAAPPPPKPPGT